MFYEGLLSFCVFLGTGSLRLSPCKEQWHWDSSQYRGKFVETEGSPKIICHNKSVPPQLINIIYIGKTHSELSPQNLIETYISKSP